jgi:dihydrofolate synthase / folylpolyglutamate synthase
MNAETASRPADLPAWLAYLETLHPKSIAMGLQRVRSVLDRMQVAIDVPVVTVTGTNGKGSTCAMLDSMLRCAGYSVALYTSPHLLRYNERVVVDGQPADDDALVEAFNEVEDARIASDPATPLTYFEFGTLAALALFSRERLDAVILEVGLGGRLDAVNLVDADVAVLTSVDLDHMDYLGATREDIGREKAGVFRPGRPAICADRDPPRSVLDYANAIGATLLLAGRDFGAVSEGMQWRYFGPGGPRYGLPHPALRGEYQLGNAATAIAALAFLRERLAVPTSAIREGLTRVELPGRFMVLPGRPTIVLDVAHNPHAARTLASCLGSMGFHPETTAVVGMLADKDLDGVIAALRARIDRWHVASLPGPRGAPADQLRDRLIAAGVGSDSIRAFPDVERAYEAAAAAAGEADRIVVFGSFLTVAAALARGRPTPHPTHPMHPR